MQQGGEEDEARPRPRSDSKLMEHKSSVLGAVESWADPQLYRGILLAVLLHGLVPDKVSRESVLKVLCSPLSLKICTQLLFEWNVICRLRVRRTGDAELQLSES
jgi:hypothetical protein